ncbi:unnamed protein product [Arctogadus glacialis]
MGQDHLHGSGDHLQGESMLVVEVVEMVVLVEVVVTVKVVLEVVEVVFDTEVVVTVEAVVLMEVVVDVEVVVTVELEAAVVEVIEVAAEVLLDVLSVDLGEVVVDGVVVAVEVMLEAVSVEMGMEVEVVLVLAGGTGGPWLECSPGPSSAPSSCPPGPLGAHRGPKVEAPQRSSVDCKRQASDGKCPTAVVQKRIDGDMTGRTDMRVCTDLLRRGGDLDFNSAVIHQG